MIIAGLVHLHIHVSHPQPSVISALPTSTATPHRSLDEAQARSGRPWHNWHEAQLVHVTDARSDTAATLPERGRHGDRSAMGRHQRVDDRQPQSGVPLLARARDESIGTARTPAAHPPDSCPTVISDLRMASSPPVPTRTVTSALPGVCCMAFATRLRSTYRLRSEDLPKAGAVKDFQGDPSVFQSIVRASCGITGQRQAGPPVKRRTKNEPRLTA